MQEIRRDGSEVLTERATEKQVRRALASPKNVTVAIHKPGAIFETHDGVRRRFRVRDDGSLQRLTLDGTDQPWSGATTQEGAE